MCVRGALYLAEACPWCVIERERQTVCVCVCECGKSVLMYAEAIFLVMCDPSMNEL
jgi:hypothetical protein